MAQVAVDLIANTKDVSREINRTIREVSLLGQAIDTSNDIAVQTWKNAASAAKDYLNVSNATYEQQLKLDGAMRRTEERMARHAGATAASTRSMSGFDAMVAEASEHLGEHSLALGRVEFALSGFADRALGVSHVVGLLGASLGRFALGSIEITAILAGIDAVVAVYDHFTSAAREATKAEEGLIKKFEEAERMKLGGGAIGMTATALDHKIEKLTKERDALEAAVRAGSAAPSGLASSAVNPFGSGQAGTEIESALARHNLTANKTELEKKNADLKGALAERDEILRKGAESEDRRFTGDLAALVSHNHATQAERHNALILLKADQEALGKLAESDVAGRAALAGEIDKLNSALFPKVKSEKGLPGAELAQLHEAVRLGNAAIQALDRRMRADEQARHALDVGNLHLAETKARGMDVSSPQGALSELEVIKTKHDLRIKEIDQMNIDNDLKRALQKQADDEEVAAVEALNRRLTILGDRRDKEDVRRAEASAKRHEAIVRDRTRIIEAAEVQGINAIVAARKDLGRQLLRAALEPEVRLMEGLAAKQFALGWGDLADHNYPGAAKHFKAAAVFGAEAGVIAGIAGGGGGGSGGGGGGGGGGFGSGGHAGALLGAHGTSDRMLKIEIVNVTRDQNGREVARTRQMIQRLDDQNMPVRVTL